jgi:N-acetylneuraminic acid mutarotase
MATKNAIANFSPNLVQLDNGDVLAFGGTLSGAPTAIAQLYSAATNTWSAVGSMTQARSGAVGAYLLASGDVLVVGGADESGVPLATAEIYHH